MNLILIGYRGTGKSVVGKILAQHLQLPYIGMDATIVDRAGMSIPDIVAQQGWAKFRDMETEVAEILAQQDNTIIDTGGGVIEREENIQALKTKGLIFWLKASVATIVDRIQDSIDRPALIEGRTFTDEVAEVLAQRTAKYRAAAHHEIDTDPLTPQQVANAILAIWQKN